MARHLLFLSQRIPYPPNKGDKVRSWNMLVRLAEHYRIHLGCFIDDPQDWAFTAKLEQLCESCCFVPLNPHWAKVRALPALLTGDALTIPHFRDRRLVDWLHRLRHDNEIETVFVYSSGVADYVMNGEWTGKRRVVDMVDVDSDKWRQYSDGKSGLAKWIYRREGVELLAFERKAAAQFDATIFVSEAEADLFRGLAPESKDRVRAISNGVDAEFFDPDQELPTPYGSDEIAIAFTGAMDYWPNIDGAVWFADHVLAELSRQHPRVQFYIVGSNPSSGVMALADRAGVTVTGRVEDIRPYIRHAHAIVAPLRIARGIQNKVLEGMAMARVVVASPMALEGLRPEVGKVVLRAETAEEFVASLGAVIAGQVDPALGAMARDVVVGDYGWDASFRQLLTIIEPENPCAPAGDTALTSSRGRSAP